MHLCSSFPKSWIALATIILSYPIWVKDAPNSSVPLGNKDLWKFGSKCEFPELFPDICGVDGLEDTDGLEPAFGVITGSEFSAAIADWKNMNFGVQILVSPC